MKKSEILQIDKENKCNIKHPIYYINITKLYRYTKTYRKFGLQIL